MRNINDYFEKYIQSNFEETQVAFRRKKVLESIEQYRHQRVLEVGCGTKPLFKFFDDFEEMTIVEPCDEFIKTAYPLWSSKNN